MSQQDFWNAEPFPHLIIDDLLPTDLLRRASHEFEEVAPEAWHRYDGSFEKGKATCNRWHAMPETCSSILQWLTSRTAASICEALTGIDGLQSDSELYGGGLHATSRGGLLGLHLDNEVHPTTGLARRLNLIVYCTEDWQEEWGGHLELWDRARERPVKLIAPMFNRAVVFETSSHSFHGHTKPLSCPETIRRKSLAVYYWSIPRKRARFVSARGDWSDATAEEERILRSM